MISQSISKRVLTVGENYINPRGGIAAVINTYSRHFAEFKFTSTFKPIKFKLMMIFNFIRGVINLLGTLAADREIKIVHIHGAAKGSILRKYIVYLISKKIFNKKVIYHIHGSEFEKFHSTSSNFVKNLMQNFIGGVDLIICLSSKWKFFFETNFQVKKIEILENIIDRPKLRPNKDEMLLTALFLGYIGNRKGIFDLIEVINENKVSLNGKLQVLVGGNGEVSKLESLINTYNIDSIVKYVGWVSGDLKCSLLNKSDVYILPSYNEGLPISILEAMSYGLPVISTPVGGITEVIIDKHNGFIVEPGNKTEIFKALYDFVQNRKLAHVMGTQAKKLIEPYYADNVIPKLENIYHQLLND